jgi:hypothetical protein
MEDLALQVRLVDDITVDQSDRPHAGRCQVNPGRRPETSGSNQQHLALQKLELALFTYLWNF